MRHQKALSKLCGCNYPFLNLKMFQNWTENDQNSPTNRKNGLELFLVQFFVQKSEFEFEFIRANEQYFRFELESLYSFLKF